MASASPPRSLAPRTPNTTKSSAKKKVNAAAEMEFLLQMTAGPLESSVLPRWKRKKKNVEVPSPSPVKRQKITNDRFIPNRAAMDIKVSSLKSVETKPTTSTSGESTPQQSFQACLAQSILGTNDVDGHRILAFKDKPPVADDPASFHGSLNALYSKRSTVTKVKPLLQRHIPSAPTKVLDAPELMDDYYLNLLSWGRNNVLAVALGASLYLWNASTGSIDELMSMEGDDYISSVSWIQEGNTLAIGGSDSTVQLWDADACKRLRTLDGHSARVGSLSWNRHILSTGSRDTSILHHDVRVQNHIVATLNSHEQEVCGLSWSPDGTKLASGGNDNVLCIWNQMNTTPMHKLTDHTAAVKALAWCPWERNVLASGGGTADRTIKIWNAQTGANLHSTDTGSQVCSLLWSPTEKELLSSHGYAQNELCLWSYPTMKKVKELTGHSARVLHLAGGPDLTTVVSGAADETLRFWNVFAPPAVTKKAPSSHTVGFRSASIR
ncbi:hypothetical protein THRCLA_09512 [Thraustotheca clavata]|uniref:CDC20/Fizzy WD40 domain-containing protein n=1 Tax=Thraustotheca clavata TaxID=74557 RepID=A0A1V9YVX9_9STRA|nr:hypothetical protein THRCLA_09512 [Thraustotheca clavata]